MQTSEEQSTFRGVLPERGSDLATEDDIYYAYRLLLGREPDAEGWAQLRKIVVDAKISPDELARMFMASLEFLSRRIEVPQECGLLEVQLDGFALFVRGDDRDIGREICARRQYEPHVTAAMRELLRTDDVFIDVGANIGYFTNLAAALVGCDGFILAIEPMDKNVQLIHRSIERNGFAHVRVLCCAASDRDGRVTMRTDSGTSNGQVLASGEAGPRALYAQALRLDDLVRDLPRINLVKLDIEGFEIFAWRGFREGLHRHRPHVLTEFHPYCMRTFVGIEPRDYLDELFPYGSVEVLPARGARIPCATRDDLMRAWDAANERANADGKLHLDLLVKPHRE